MLLQATNSYPGFGIGVGMLIRSPLTDGENSLRAEISAGDLKSQILNRPPAITASKGRFVTPVDPPPATATDIAGNRALPYPESIHEVVHEYHRLRPAHGSPGQV